MIFMKTMAPLSARRGEVQANIRIGLASAPMPSAEPSAPPPSQLHAPAEPYASTRLDVGDGHSLYFEQCGNPGGVPMVYLHGGPGSGCSPKHRQFFDPTLCRAVLFDQRGCGRSSPLGELRHNHTDALLQDMETLRDHLGIARWLVVGGSWGAGLALAYSSRHPGACLGLVLRGTFLGRPADLQWFFEGAGSLLPDAWQHLTDQVGCTRWDEVLQRLHAGVNHAEQSIALGSALAWEAWEHSLSAHTSITPRALSANDPQAMSLLRKYQIQSHYLSHQCFRHGRGLLASGLDTAHLPTALLHGRLDWICRPEAAWHIHQQLPASRLQWVEGCGHSPFEPGNAAALVATITHFANHGNFAHWGAANSVARPL